MQDGVWLAVPALLGLMSALFWAHRRPSARLHRLLQESEHRRQIARRRLPR